LDSRPRREHVEPIYIKLQTDTFAPAKRDEPRRDKLDPVFIPVSREIAKHDPMLLQSPHTVKEDPTLRKFLKDNVDPTIDVFAILVFLARLNHGRKEISEPRAAYDSMEKSLLRAVLAPTETTEPKYPRARVLIDDPTCTKSSTEVFSPKIQDILTDTALPKLAQPTTEKL
jgi:hypothetical protein